ncbi:MAG: hypothetical protein AMJ46_12805 [Latescibacteria bacterium DG_63]|nr:MAG: hypothetical protein AMJ46_12805 [Latescibacteria bacterium DG_63]
MKPTDETEDFERIIQAAEALLSDSESPGEPEGPSDDIGLPTPRAETETEAKIGNAADAQAAVKQKLQDEYGDRVGVNISKTALESDGSDGSQLWAVEGDAEVRKGLFRKKRWHFTYFLDATEGKIRIVRSSKT